MAVPPTSGARTSTVAVPRALLHALSGTLLVTLLAVAFLLGREAGRTETAAPEPLAEAPPALVEPAAARRSAAPSRPRAAAPPRPPRDDPEPAPPSPPTTPPAPTPAPSPAASAAEPAVDPHERAAVVRYFEEFDEIAGSSAGAGDPETMAMALLSQATGGDWSRFDELGDTQRSMLRRLRGLRVPSVCRDYHRKMVTLLEASATLLDNVRQGGCSPAIWVP